MGRSRSEEEEEEEEFIRIHGYYRGTQGARCYTDGASLQPDESEDCSPVSERERESARARALLWHFKF